MVSFDLVFFFNFFSSAIVSEESSLSQNDKKIKAQSEVLKDIATVNVV